MSIFTTLTTKLKFDLPLVIASFFLITLGLATTYSIGINENAGAGLDFFYRQVLFVGTGVVLFLIVNYFGFNFFRSLAVPQFIIINLFLIITFILGVESHGAVRWIDFGFFRFQPTEFAKPILLLFLIKFFEVRDIKYLINVVIALVVCFPTMLFTFLQPDLGSTLVIVFLIANTLYLCGLKLRYLLASVLIALMLVPLSWNSLHGYQKERVVSFLYPEADPSGRGYNSIQAIIAVGSGRISGVGFGKGTQSTLNFLPEKHTDFIFASFAEEFGFVGSFLMVVTFLFLLFRITFVGMRAKNSVAKAFILGSLGFIGIQAIINIGMNLGLLPITGITLPLVSYGGSSLISTIYTLALINSAGYTSA